MNIQQLRVIVELSKGKSLIEIGEAMGIAQPTVSFHIRKLEEELGISLFIKEKRRLMPTKACEELVPYAQQIIHLIDEAKHKIAIINQAAQSDLRITASYTPATYYLPQYIQMFRQENPDIDITLTVNQARKSIQLLKEHEADLAIISLQNFTIEGLNIQPLVEDKLLLTFSPQNSLASLTEITLDDIDKETFLLHEEGSTSRMVTNDWAKKTGISMSSKMELSAIETIKEGVKCNMGIGILPEKSIIQELKSGQLLAIPLPQYEYRRCICLAYRNDEQITDKMNAFIWFALEHMK